MKPLVVLNGYEVYDGYTQGTFWRSDKVTYFKTEAGQIVRQVEYVRRRGWLARLLSGDDRREVMCVDSEPLSEQKAIRRLEVETRFRYAPDRIAKWLHAKPPLEVADA